MSTATAHLLEEFDRLSAVEQRAFASIIVRKAVELDYGDITDEELTASVARMFVMLDEEEEAQKRWSVAGGSGHREGLIQARRAARN